LSDADLDRLVHGATEGTAIGTSISYDVASNNAGDPQTRFLWKRLQGGLEKRMHAFFTDNLDGGAPGDHAGSIVVVEVLR